MNPLADMNRAMAYLEAQLIGTVDYERMARIAGCSEYHFRRMFSYLAGMPLGEYIRHRRLCLAGDLLRDGSKVIDCAVLLGYDSTDAFSKAFHAMHGIPPSEAKRTGASLKAFPPMTFQLTIQGGSRMEYRITHKGPFRIVGFKKRITLQFEGVNRQTESLVRKPTPQSIAELKSLCDTEPRGMLSVSANFSERTVEGTELDQYIGVATTKPAPESYEVLPVAESDWAVFTVVGAFPAAMQDTWARIYAEWIPSSGYELIEGPEMLWHESPDLTQPQCRSEIWIPVRRRAQ